MLADRHAYRAQRGELGGPEPGSYLGQPDPGQLVDEHLLGLDVDDIGMPDRDNGLSLLGRAGRPVLRGEDRQPPRSRGREPIREQRAAFIASADPVADRRRQDVERGLGDRDLTRQQTPPCPVGVLAGERLGATAGQFDQFGEVRRVPFDQRGDGLLVEPAQPEALPRRARERGLSIWQDEAQGAIRIRGTHTDIVGCRTPAMRFASDRYVLGRRTAT